jgi:uncharacterized protein (TIGR02265 family)
MGLRADVRSLVQYCDLEERLPAVPASAQLRGLYFKNTINVMKSAGLQGRYAELFPETYSAVRWYPLADYLERHAAAGALLAGPETVHDGMRTIGHNNAQAFTESLLGKTMIRLLSRDPMRLLKQSAVGRRQSCQYGRWELHFPAPGHAVMEMYEEYIWIESNVAGAAEGTMAVTSVPVKNRCELDSKFRGRHVFEW